MRIKYFAFCKLKKRDVLEGCLRLIFEIKEFDFLLFLFLFLPLKTL